jgi:hypothetical protein
MNVIDKTNSIIRAWKIGFIETANKYPGWNVLPVDFADKSYSKIFGDAAAGRKGMRFYHTKPIIYNLIKTIGAFDNDPEVLRFYRETFEAPRMFAISLYRDPTELDWWCAGLEDKDRALGYHYRVNGGKKFDVIWNISREDRYIISPAGGKTNGGRPMGMREVPNMEGILEIFFETKDPNALAVDDFLETFDDRGFTIKGVPELPRDMIAYASNRNIRLR